MTLLGVEDNWSATIRTAVRSSMESPKEMTSFLGAGFSIADASLPESDETSVDSKLRFEEVLETFSTSSYPSSSTDPQASKSSLTSWAKAAAFQQRGCLG